MPPETQTTLGRNVARYRKMAKMSGEELAAAAGTGLTRSIIANLENGRKEDVSVTQLMALAFALRVSPADLMFDLQKPYEFIPITQPPAPEVLMATWLARDWWGGALPVNNTAALIEGVPIQEGEHTPLDLGTYSTAYYLKRRSILLQDLAMQEGYLREARQAAREGGLRIDEDFARDTQAKIRDVQAELYRIETDLRRLNVDLDFPVHAGGYAPF